MSLHENMRKPRTGLCGLRLCRNVAGFLDMRFSRKEMEEAYVKSVETEVIRWMGVCTALCGIFAITPMTIWIWTLQLSRTDVPFTWQLEDPRSFLVAGWAGIAVSCVLCSSTAQCRLSFGWFAWMNFELGAVAFSCYGGLVATLVTLKFVPRAYGMDPVDVWNMPLEDGSTTMALMCCGILAGTCTMAPIRCLYMWIVPVVVVVAYSVSASVTEGLYFPLDFVILAVVANFCLISAARRERNLRDKFLATFHERQATQEKEAFSCLLEMTCECAVWIGDDGKTIIRSHRWLDFFMEQQMEGLSFYEALAAEGGQRQRLRQLLQQVGKCRGQAGEDAPVRLLQTKLTSHRNEVDVDLFVADRRQAGTAWAQDLAFLIGIRCHADPGLLEMSSNIVLPPEAAYVADTVDSTNPGQSSDSHSGVTDLSVQTPTQSSHIVTVPSTAEVLLCIEDDKLRPVPVSSVAVGDKLYCSTCDREPMLLPVSVTTTAFLGNVECNEVAVGEDVDAAEALEVVDNNCICMHVGGQRYRWMQPTSRNLEIPHTAVSIDLKTARYGFEATTAKCLKVSAGGSVKAMQLKLNTRAAPCVRLSTPSGKSQSRFMPVASEAAIPAWMKQIEESPARAANPYYDHMSAASSSRLSSSQKTDVASSYASHDHSSAIYSTRAPSRQTASTASTFELTAGRGATRATSRSGSGGPGCFTL
eukprot:TRINITY_DN29532_c0_g1_i1.p1 TRINITY_DN29532_c0_g1~~TRINITY_DN29532_c0_g1_i1.p1  ORF type:complete len:700 (-),score=75.32 TRINITY_DN29532_c0_g1_i1:426-2525(-)